MRVTFLGNETAEGRIKAVTERAITVEDDMGRSIPLSLERRYKGGGSKAPQSSRSWVKG